ncbi:hypothetical protein AB0K16_46605 [Nonomuraea jabiensis]|uniref:hypothetical protein n=1 Tax=Nonomuraea jabiensis TaxID=882448 RepID=UPI00342762E3
MRQLAHAHGPIGRLGEQDQQLVVGRRHACPGQQIALQAVGQQAAGQAEGPPGPLFVVVEPSRHEAIVLNGFALK